MSGRRSVRARFVNRRALRRVGWLLLAFVVVAAALSTVSVDRILRRLGGADQEVVVVVAALLVLALCCRGLVLWLTLRALDAPVGVGRGLGTALVVRLVNTIAPGGGAGGTPVAGLVVARSADADYEVGVAATVAVSTLANVTVSAFGVVGLLLLLLTAGPTAVPAAGWVGVVAVAVGGLVAVVGWRGRTRLGPAAISLTAGFLQRLDRRLPWNLPDRAAVAAHARRFDDAVTRLVDGPPAQTAALLGLSAAAHLFSVLALYSAFASLGIPVSVGVLLAVIPAAVLGGVTPAPAGGGGVEIALGVLLASATGQPAAAVGAAVLLYRGTDYAFRLTLGAAAAVGLSLVS